MSMKRALPVFLAFSLLANALCLAVWWRAGRAVMALGASTPAVRVPSAPRPAYDAGTAARLKHDDLREYAARLRQAGFPGDMVRAIIVAQLGENNESRRRAVWGTPDEVNYWKQPSRSPAEEKAVRELRREENRLLREALGADAESPDSLNYSRDTAGLAILSAEKAERVRQLLRERDERREDLYAINGYTSEGLSAADREFRNSLRRVLTPSEALEYELRTSSRARLLREELAGSGVTEAEFRSIYDLKTAFDEQFEPGLRSSDPAQDPVRTKAGEMLRDQIRAQLGPERAAEYERMGDYYYKRTTEVIARLGLPRETAAQISTVQQDLTQRRKDLIAAINSSTLNREAGLARLQGLRQEAASRLTPLLGGSRGFDVYRQYAGAWIGNLMPVRDDVK